MAETLGRDPPAAGTPERATELAAPPLVPAEEEDAQLPRHHPATYALFALMLCAAIFRVGYSYLSTHHLDQGAAMFVGPPVVLGPVVTFARFPRSPLGMVCKVTALLLCIVALLLDEGVIWIATAAPLIFGIIGMTALIGRLLGGQSGRRL